MSSVPASRTIRPGQPLFTEGEIPKSLFLITKGTIAIRKMKGAAFVEIARLYSNEIVGELSFFDRQTRSASAFALTEVEVTEIPFDSLEKLFASTPPYLKGMIAAMADRLRKANDMIKRLQKNTVTAGDAVEAHQEEVMDAAAALAVAAAALDGSTAGGTDGAPEGENA
jgi:CRP/FNR family cyclic AMP-dependent transcriptional regulator